MNIEREIEGIEKTISDLNKRFQNEISRVQRRNKLMIFLFPVILLIAVGYCGYIYSFVDQSFNAEEVAAYFETIFYNRIYNGMPRLEKYLSESAPQITKQLVDETMRSIPLLRREAQNNLDTMAEIFVNRLTSKFIFSLHDTLKENKGIIETLPQMVDEKNIYIFANQLANEIKQQLDNSPEIDLPALAKSISNVDVELKSLLKDDLKLTEGQRLEKRFVKLLLQMVDEGKLNLKIE